MLYVSHVLSLGRLGCLFFFFAVVNYRVTPIFLFRIITVLSVLHGKQLGLTSRFAVLDGSAGR